MNTNRKYISFLLLLLIISSYSCGVGSSDQSLFDPDQLTQCDSKAECEGILEIGYLNLFQTLVSSYGVNMHLLADQVTSTNNVRGFYTAAQEPRENINNSSSNGREAINYEVFFSNFSQSIAIANGVLESISFFEPSDQEQIRAKAYFLRGVAIGYLGLIYDKAVYYPNNTDEFIFLSYSDLVDSSLSDLDAVISLAENSTTGFNFDGIPGGNSSWGEAELLTITNSLAARILAGKARTYDEAIQLDWERVLQYANNGIGTENSSLNVFSLQTLSSNANFSNQLADWLNFIIEGDFETGAGYIPPDVMVIHLLDENYPTEYPVEGISGGQLVLEAAVSDDPRLEAYYKNTQNSGFLRQDRNTALFSNYINKRMHADNDWLETENDIVFFTNSEINYLKAEALIMLNRSNEAAQILNESAAGTGTTFLGFSLPALRKQYIPENSLSGNHLFDGSESISEFQLALLREYSVELDFLGGIGLPWFYMRRHDLLQEGTPTMYPIPALNLELLDVPIYTFGGVNRAGQPGTASGENSWKILRAKIASD